MLRTPRAVPAVLTAAAAALTTVTLSAPEAHAVVVVDGVVRYVVDGDTIDVDIRGDGTGVPKRVRFTATQTPELTVYSHDLTKIRGECHAVAATKRLHQLVFAKRVRLTALQADSMAGKRLRRAVDVQLDGTWRDVGAIMVREGRSLVSYQPVEYEKNQEYRDLVQRAAAAGLRIWDRDSCGSGPSQATPLTMTVNWNAPGDDTLNPNGEWFRVTNAGQTRVSLSGWWVRDSALRRFTFPSGAGVAAGDSVFVHPGDGTSTPTHFYWGLGHPVLQNVTGAPTYMGDGGFLYDPQGDIRAWQQYPCVFAC